MWQRTKNKYHFIKGHLANKIYKSPGKKLICIGVTGTDGKTTTATMIYTVLKNAGYKTALITTVSAIIEDHVFDTGFHVSTPDAFALQSYLKRALDAGVTHVVLEVTSHSLDQYRVLGIPFKVGVLTNISREHLDYHKSMENYMLAKGKLLKAAQVAILNKDDESYSFFKEHIGRKKVVTYARSLEADVTPQDISLPQTIPGDFNVSNMLAATAACFALGIDRAVIEAGLKRVSLPEGRFEVVYDSDFKVIIDFAHTPNSLEQLLQTVKKTTKGKITHVFGCAGKRDRGKRGPMGEVSARYADRIILTAEDPRDEKIHDINAMIKKGMKGHTDIQEIESRTEAIFYAITHAGKGDTVLLTGKGHEKSMNFGNGETPWNEHEEVYKILKENGKN